MNILWISSRIFNNQEESQSGVWQKALAEKIVRMPGIVLGNISYGSQSNGIVKFEYNKIKQWGIPRYGKTIKGDPSEQTRKLFAKAVSEFKPDIIHVWGSENPFKLLPFDHAIPGIKVLAMQGVLGSISPVLFSGLNFKELISTLGLRELILRTNLFLIRRSFKLDSKIEIKMIEKSDFIITQSDWTDSQLWQVKPNNKFFRVTRALRSDFLKSRKWYEFEHNKPVIYSAAVGYSLKGLHVLIKALSIVKKEYPAVELRLAGKTGRKDFLGDGYLRLILRMIRNDDLEENVTWVGALTAEEIVKQLQEASVFVNPSYIESYSLTLAEAMSVGTPSVVSFAGAMPELAENSKEALFFTPGDYKRCAYLIIKLLSDQDLALKISQNAVKRSEQRELKNDVVKIQIEIYKEIIRLSKTE